MAAHKKMRWQMTWGRGRGRGRGRGTGWPTRLAAAGCLAWLAAAGSSAWGAHADGQSDSRAAELADLPLDALLDMPVVGASKLGLRMSESAASVTVITAAEIRALGHRTLADVLRTVRGLSVSDDRSYSYLGVRGFFAPGDYNTRVLLLVDGYRTNDVVYDQAYLGSEFPIDLDLVERVEFIPGQASAVYGANALFGVVNVITRKPGAVGVDGVSAQWSSGARRQLRVGHTHRLKDGTSLLWSASRLLARGEEVTGPGQASPLAPDGVARGTDGERRTALYLRATRGDLSFSAVHAERLKGAPFIAGAVFGDDRASNRDHQSMIDLTWSPALDEHHGMTLRGFAGRYRFQGFYSFDYPPVTLNRDDASARWWGGEVRWASQRWSGHRLSVGAEWQQVSRLTQQNRDVDPPSDLYLDDRRGARRVSLFAEDQIALGARWELGLAGRLDHIHRHGRRFSPRTALVWRPSEGWVAKLIHGRAYRPPNAFEAWYEVLTVGGYLRNPALQGESVRGSELALEWRPSARDRVSVSLYRNRAEGLLLLTHDEAVDLLQFRNLGTLRATGLELEAERLWTSGARLRASLSLQDADEREGGPSVTRYAPARMLKITGTLPLVEDMTLGAEARGIARRGDAPGFGVVNLTLSTPLQARGAAVSLSVRNVFDRAISDPGPDPALVPTVPQPGRTVHLRLDWAI